MYELITVLLIPCIERFMHSAPPPASRKTRPRSTIRLRKSFRVAERLCTPGAREGLRPSDLPPDAGRAATFAKHPAK